MSETKWKKWGKARYEDNKEKKNEYQKAYSQKKRDEHRKLHPKINKTDDPNYRKKQLAHFNTVHPLYAVWCGMKQRCYNPQATGYARYGGRGIKVCDRWKDDYEMFEADMSGRPIGTSLDRINNDGDYEPSNVKWSTPKEQANNRR